MGVNDEAEIKTASPKQTEIDLIADLESAVQVLGEFMFAPDSASVVGSETKQMHQPYPLRFGPHFRWIITAVSFLILQVPKNRYYRASRLMRQRNLC